MQVANHWQGVGDRGPGPGRGCQSQAWGQAQRPPPSSPPPPATHLPVVATQDGLQAGPELHEGGALALQRVRGGRGCSGRGPLLGRAVGAGARPSPSAVGRPARAAGCGPRSPACAGALRQQQGQGREDVHVPQDLLGVQQVLQERLQPRWGWRLLRGSRAIGAVQAQLRGNRVSGQTQAQGRAQGLGAALQGRLRSAWNREDTRRRHRRRAGEQPGGQGVPTRDGETGWTEGPGQGTQAQPRCQICRLAGGQASPAGRSWPHPVGSGAQQPAPRSGGHAPQPALCRLRPGNPAALSADPGAQ